MQAVAFYEHGGPEVLQVVDDWPEPKAGPGEAVIEVKACGLNHLDIFVRRGLPSVEIALPHVSGGDIAGQVIEVGEGVTDVRVGDRVLVDPTFGVGAIGENIPGGLCERFGTEAERLIPIPDAVSYEQAAALPIAYGTAYRMIVTRGKVQAGETVVILGASGGVGTACVQLAKMAGATVFAVSGSAEKLERLRELGADYLIEARGAEYGKEVWRLTGKQGADVIVDYTGAETWPTTVRTLKPGGRIIVCGATTGFNVQMDLRYVWVREETIVGCNAWDRSDIEALLRLVAEGRIVPVIDRVVPLEETRAAEEALERREVFGKIIVRP